MRVAITHENGEIYQHFGHTAEFKVYDIENDNIIHSEVIATNGSGHGALADLLNELNANVLICGGIGGCALAALNEYGIDLYAGIQGNTDDVIKSFLAGELPQVKTANCSHHEHAHGEGHTCGHCH